VKVALDTNVLAYVEGVGDEARRAEAERLVALLSIEGVILPTQVAGELYNVLRRKKGLSQAEAATAVMRWSDFYSLAPHTTQTFADAISLAAEHDKQIWDALILSIAAACGCRLLLSEDMQDGFVYRGVTVANPFAERLHPLLASLLDTLSQDPPAGAPK
jgi:predicted nucleic acid-binding protein